MRLGIPALIVAVLAIIALWRVGPPPDKAAPVATTGSGPEKVLGAPIEDAAELLSNNSVGREASLEHVQVRELVGGRGLWIGSAGIGPYSAPRSRRQARRSGRTAGGNASHPRRHCPAGPTAADAEQRWQVPAAQATLIEQSGTYL